jgi:hypothetical protein
LLIQSECHNCKVTVGLFKVALVSSSLILDRCNLLLDLILISLVRVANLFEGIQAFSFVGLKFILEFLHASVKNLTFKVEVLFLLLLAAGKLFLNGFEMSSYGIFVILTYEVYETVNLI